MTGCGIVMTGSGTVLSGSWRLRRAVIMKRLESNIMCFYVICKLMLNDIICLLIECNCSVYSISGDFLYYLCYGSNL